MNEAQLAAAMDDLERVTTERKLQADNARLRAALGEYGNDDNWYTVEDMIGWVGPGEHGSSIAQEALERMMP